MFQINIKVITITSNNVTRINFLGPHLKIEPKVKEDIQDMTLIHYDESHFNLVISRDSYILKDSKDIKSNFLDSKELEDLDQKRKIEELQKINDINSKKIKILENKLKQCSLNHSSMDTYDVNEVEKD